MGQILWVTPGQLWAETGLTAVLLALWFGLGRVGFYLLFAVAVTASVQLVGVYLVFSSLIMPALAVRKAATRWQLPLAWLGGALAYALGLVLSAVLDLPSGAVVVVAMAGVCTGVAAGLSLRRAAA